MTSKPFQFKKFNIEQDQCSMKIGTDGVLLGAWVDIESTTNRILDIGTGTGVIAIMLAQRATNAEVVGVEIETKSALQAEANMNASPYKERLSLFEESIQHFAHNATEKFDLIVSNPPFFSGGTFSDNQERNNVRHTVKLPNGDLLRSANNLLNKKNGRFCVILPFIEGLRFKEMATQYGFYSSKITKVKPKIDKPVERLLMEFKNNPVTQVMEDELIIQEGGRNEFTPAYTALTKDFYLNM